VPSVVIPVPRVLCHQLGRIAELCSWKVYACSREDMHQTLPVGTPEMSIVSALQSLGASAR